jgi:hypothetical protein
MSMLRRDFVLLRPWTSFQQMCDKWRFKPEKTAIQLVPTFLFVRQCALREPLSRSYLWTQCTSIASAGPMGITLI